MIQPNMFFDILLTVFVWLAFGCWCHTDRGELQQVWPGTLPTAEEWISFKHQWRCYVEGLPITIRTDHKPLIYAQGKKDIPPRLLKWIEELQHYQPIIEYKRGKENILADALSRREDWKEDHLNNILEAEYSDWPSYVPQYLEDQTLPAECDAELQAKIRQQVYPCRHQGRRLFYLFVMSLQQKGKVHESSKWQQSKVRTR